MSDTDLQNEEPNPDCEECGGDGEVPRFFSHKGNKTIRIVHYYCPTCYPDSDVTGGEVVSYSEKPGEQIVEGEEAYSLIDAGWAEIDGD